MTVIENLHPRVQYTYNSSSQTYPITFPYIERPYVKCMVKDQELIYNTHYQVPVFDPVSLDRDELYLTLLISPNNDLDDGITIEDGDLITIYRETPREQQAEFPQTAKFSSQKITEALDKLTLLIQELDDTLDSCVRLSKEAPIDFNVILPIPTANQVLQWNSEGTQLINYDLRGEINTISNTAASAVSTANSAASNAAAAVSTANTASTNAAAAVSTANTASTNASNAVSTANTASTNASNAVNTANAASVTASSAVSTANTASTNASSALSKANTALSTANTASTNASNAVSTANTASTNASNAVSTANTASTNASNAVSTANTASTNASTALSTANTAKNTADIASGKVDAFGEDIATVLAAAEKINELEEAVETATTAATNASTAANTATSKASEATTAAGTATSKAQEATNAVAAIKQPDWNELDSDSKAFIKNKPDLTVYATQTDLTNGLATKQDTLIAGTDLEIVNSTTPRLPAGFTELEWLQSDGACYIDLGIISYGNDEIEQKYQRPSTFSSDLVSWFGSIQNNAVPRFSIGVSGSSGVFAGFNFTKPLAEYDNNIHIITLKKVGSTYYAGFDDATASYAPTSASTNPSINSYLFARNSSTITYDGTGTRIFYHKQNRYDGTPLLDLVPAKRDSDNALGMYNLVSNTFLGNSGTGTFTGGPEVIYPTITTINFTNASGFEVTSNKTTSLSSSSTDTQYPSAKVTYDSIVKHQLIQNMDTADNSNVTSSSINLSIYQSIHVRNFSANTTLTFNTNGISGYYDGNNTYTFELLLYMTTNVYTIAFPSTVSWQNNESPDLSSTGVYWFAFRTTSGGLDWFGSLEGKW